MTTETNYVYGSNEALAAEFGIDAGGPFAFVQFYQGEISQWFPCDTLAQCKTELAEMTDGDVSYLA